jgi:cytochrome c5
MMNATRKSTSGVTFPLMFAALTMMLAAANMASSQTPASATTATAQVTFTKDIAPILQNKCQTCHRAGGIAPMPLTTYEETRPWAPLIKQRVVGRTMPPWFIDKTVGIQHFENDISLSNQQIATISKWVDESAPLGDPKDMPPPKTFADTSSGWQLATVLGRQPDLVIDGADFTVKANDQDQWYRPVTDLGITEPRWIMAIEIRPSNPESRRVFHHIMANLDQDETNAPSAQVKVSFDKDMDGTVRPMMPGFLAEYAIGKNYDIFREGTGKLLMPGAKIRWEYHTHSVNKDITGHPVLALYFYPKGQTPKYRTYLTSFSGIDGRLDIPPNSIHVTQGFHVLRAAARLESYQVHLHLRGKSMAMEAILPDGTTQMLSYVPQFYFNWMVNYIYSDDAAPVLPRGTVIQIVAVHDNTKSNPNNPDPDQWVGEGGRTVDEMAHAWVNVTYIPDEEYKEWAAKHPHSMKGMNMAEQ